MYKYSRIIFIFIFLMFFTHSENVLAADMCGEKTLERQSILSANQSYCLTDYGHYLWIYIPLNNSNVTITTTGGSFVYSNGASIELYSDESWDNDKIIDQIDTPNSNEESISFVSGVGNHYFTIGGDVTEMTLTVTVTGGDERAALDDYIVFDTNVPVTVPVAILSNKSEFTAVVNQIISENSSEQRTIAENNAGSLIDIAHAIHFLAEQDDISDSDFTKLMPFIEQYKRYGTDVTDAEALAVNNALLAVANMTGFVQTGTSASQIQQLYSDALYIFERGVLASYYPQHLPHLLAIIQLYSLQSNPFNIDGAFDSLKKIMSDMKYPFSSGDNGFVNAFNNQMLDVLSVIRSFTLLGETSLDRRWTSNNDLTWFTYYPYQLLAKIYLVANDDAKTRIDSLFKNIHQTLILEVEQEYFEKIITEDFIEPADRVCSVDDSLSGYCWVRPKQEDILTVSYSCTANLTIRAQASISNETLVRSCTKMAELESKFHSVFSTEGSPLVGDTNAHLEVVAFASPAEYKKYAGEFFGINTDNGGMYLEGSPSANGNQARFIAMQCLDSWVGNSCEVTDEIYNLEHEFVHYLDGRYIKEGAYANYSYVVAWAEGLSEYLAHDQDHTRTLANIDGLVIPPLYNVLFMAYGYEELYEWAYFAIRYLAEQHPADFQSLANSLKIGDNSAFTAKLRSVSDITEAGFEAFVLANSTAVAPVVAQLPDENLLGTCDLAQQYTRKYDAPTADSLTITNNTAVPISLFWITDTTGKVSNTNYKTLEQGESYTTTYWKQTDRLMLTDDNRNCVAVAVLTTSVNSFTIEEKDVENVVIEVLPEANQLGSCQLMQPYIPSPQAHQFSVTNTTNYPVHVFRIDDKTGNPIYSKLYDTLAYGESYTAGFWYANRRVMLADASLNCLAIGVLDQPTADFVIDETITENAALPKVLPQSNVIGSCELVEKHLIDDVAYTFSVTNTTDTAINIYRVDNNTGEILIDDLYETLAKGETFNADYWYGLRRVALTDDSNQCLGVAILSQKDMLNEFTVTDEHIDTDGDSVVDADDDFPLDPTESKDTDEDGVGDNSDAFPEDATENKDTDEDGVGDNSDAFPEDATENKDTDEDGIGDNSDAFPEDVTENKDTDEDGVGDNSDVFPEDATESKDTDADGVGDNSDAFPEDSTESVDTDADSISDNNDAFPEDATESKDTDEDGVGDNSDAFPEDSTESADTDGDGVGDNSDAFPKDKRETLDTDGDGVGDNSDAFPGDETETLDINSNGIGDNSEAVINEANKQRAEPSSTRTGGSSPYLFMLLLIIAFTRKRGVVTSSLAR
jgi:hypothetical protein